MIEKHYLPTVILGGMNGQIRGSVRSVEGLDIHAVPLTGYALDEPLLASALLFRWPAPTGA